MTKHDKQIIYRLMNKIAKSPGTPWFLCVDLPKRFRRNLEIFRPATLDNNHAPWWSDDLNTRAQDNNERLIALAMIAEIPLKDL